VYETTPDAVEDGGGVAPEAGEGWQGPSQDEWNQLVGFQQNVTPFLSELAQALQQDQPNYEAGQTGDYSQQPQEPDFDPFDPESVQQYIQAQVSQGVESALDPYSGVLGLVATREGEALAHKELESLRSDVGQFDQDTALLIASGMIDQGREPGEALRASAEFARDYEAKVRADAVEAYKKELQTLASGGDVPAGDGRSAEVPPKTPTGQDRYKAAVENALARHRASGIVG